MTLCPCQALWSDNLTITLAALGSFWATFDPEFQSELIELIRRPIEGNLFLIYKQFIP
jgi:hypothetical protein